VTFEQLENVGEGDPRVVDLTAAAAADEFDVDISIEVTDRIPDLSAAADAGAFRGGE
jgi:hypothetical protein